jgi:hypothetical protein
MRLRAVQTGAVVKKEGPVRRLVRQAQAIVGTRGQPFKLVLLRLRFLRPEDDAARERLAEIIRMNQRRRP